MLDTSDWKMWLLGLMGFCGIYDGPVDNWHLQFQVLP
jgi:hypothetical protein